MSVTWAGGEACSLPPLRALDIVRLILRSVVLVVATGGCFTLFLLLQRIDSARGLVGGPGREGTSLTALRLWARLGARLAGLRVEQVGHPMEMPGVIVSNHASWLDIVLLMRSAKVIFVSKAEVRQWPVIGAIGKAVDTVFIERKTADTKRQQAIIGGRLARGDRMAIFPEGTSTDGLRVLRFRSSLFEVLFTPDLRERLWVQPVTIVYFPPEELPRSFYAWWGGAEFTTSLRDVLGRARGGRAAVVFHPPLRVADFLGRKTLARHAEAIVRKELDARLSGAAERWQTAEEAEQCAGAT